MIVIVVVVTAIVMVVIPILVVIMVVPIVVPIVLVMLLAPVIALFLAMHLSLVFLMLAHFMSEVLLTLALVHLMARCVHVVIPAVGHEIDRSSAGVVFLTVSRPVPLVTRWHVQIEGGRRCLDNLSRGHGDDGSRQDQLGRGDIRSDRQLPVNTGSVQIDGDTHVTRESHRL